MVTPVVLYQDDYIIAVSKVSGQHVHPSEFSPNERSLMQDVRDYLGERVDPVHRIDRASSGLVLFSRKKDITGALAGLFRTAGVEKHYWALTRGWIQSPGLHESLDQNATGAVTMRTYFEPLYQCELPLSDGRHPTMRLIVVEAQPETGRRHQIRRHLASLSHPIIGDVRYGSGVHNRVFREQFKIHRLMLFARRISFVHPATGMWCSIDAPISDTPVLDFFNHIGFDVDRDLTPPYRKTVEQSQNQRF